MLRVRLLPFLGTPSQAVFVRFTPALYSMEEDL